MTMTPEKLIVLIAHGSRDPRWRQPFEALLAKVEAENAQNPVVLCYMEMASPTLFEVLEPYKTAPPKQLEILPLFMSAGSHYTADIQPMVERVRQWFPCATVLLHPPIGEHSAFQRLFLDVVVGLAG
jgi:sirohydrochlorin cobaltochelatase